MSPSASGGLSIIPGGPNAAGPTALHTADACAFRVTLNRNNIPTPTSFAGHNSRPHAAATGTDLPPFVFQDGWTA
jgi:hypothetical protein